MAKPSLGKFHICSECGTRFFDMLREPPACPKCGTVITAKSLHTKDEKTKSGSKKRDVFVEDIGDIDEIDGGYDEDLETEIDEDLGAVSAADDDFGEEEEEED